MSSTLESTVADLNGAVELLDRETVKRLANEFIVDVRGDGSTVSVDVAKRVLSTLRRKRFFPEMQGIADALIQSNQGYPVVLRQYAQSLIDQGALTAADAVLKEALPETRIDISEDAELRGLMGRTQKQRYIEAVRAFPLGSAERQKIAQRYAPSIVRATEYYYQAFREDEKSNYWHGINAVACSMRGQRDGISAKVADPRAIAEQILQRIEDAGARADIWQIATAIEACVALDDGRGAGGWALEYVQQQPREDGSRADAFEIASTLRQLSEVWELDHAGGIGRNLLPVLKGGLLQRESGFTSLSPTEVSQSADNLTAIRDELRKTQRGERLEKVFGSDAFMSLNTYEAGRRRAKTVARVGVEAARGEGSGFLVCGRELSERFGDELLLVTNSHVISANAENRPATRPEEAVITFDGLPRLPNGSAETYNVGSIIWESSPKELDTTVVTLDRAVAGVSSADCGQVALLLPKNDQKQRVYIIGYPKWGGLNFSMQDNILLDYEDPRLHYRTPTDEGSSGSPVYDAQWKLIGIHHAGSREMPRLRRQPGSYKANEGLWIQAIRRAIGSN